ncbi:MAG: hypothetical protein NVSMB39_6990 [Candidatus Saccharimonadales bacterium]
MKFQLAGIGVIGIGLIIALIGNAISGTAGTIVLFIGFLVAAIGATMASPFGW